jgi:hypothetical protein
MTEEDEEFNRIERESKMRQESVRAVVKQDQSSDLIDRLSEHWAMLDPVDPLKNLINRAIQELANAPFKPDWANFESGRQVGRQEVLEVAYKQSLAYGKTGECMWLGIQINARRIS